MSKFDDFTIEELQEIFITSKSFNEIQQRCGYKPHTSRNSLIKEIAMKNNIALFGNKDLVNQVFGELTIISKNLEISKEKGRTYWNCRCSCGNSCVAAEVNLKNGSKKSCGCLNMPNLVGKIFNNIKVIDKNEEKSNKNNGQFWNVECLLCHKRFILSTHSLQNGQKDCGCSKTYDLVGKKFNFLTVIEKVGTDSNRNIMWKCQCKCGKFILGSTTKIMSGKLKSCGCYTQSIEYKAAQRQDLTNQIFGFLKPIKINEAYSKEKQKIYWDCLCTNCNSTITVSANNLRKGQISCGCIRSKGEIYISKILNENNIKFKKEISFSDLKGRKGKLRFDFGIYDENDKLVKLIEYNGIQHYKPIDFFGGEQQFSLQQENDKKKKEYCQKHNIPLIIFSSIEEITIESIRGEERG